MSTSARLIGKPAATARSQNPLTSAASDSPRRPALASQAFNASMPWSAIMLVPDISFSLADVALHPVSEPHHSAAQCFRGDMPKRLTGCGPRIGLANKFENARAHRPIHLSQDKQEG